jgi:hydroxymethylbilane synthase
VSVRGNVDTRLRKLAEGQYDALVLAAAGLHRLGLEPDGILDELVPAAGQGALALEARIGQSFPALADADATVAVSAERELVHSLGASCNTPLGAHALVGDGELELSAWVGLPDGSEWLRDRVRGGLDETGRTVAGRLLASGAARLLRQSERELAQ